MSDAPPGSGIAWVRSCLICLGILFLIVLFFAFLIVPTLYEHGSSLEVHPREEMEKPAGPSSPQG